MRRATVVLVGLLAGLACSRDAAESTAPSDPTDPTDPLDPATPGTGTGAGPTPGSGSTVTADPCSPVALREPRAALTYYVAIDEQGADNDACDGLSPIDVGGGRCPFADFTSDRTMRLLDGVAGTRLEVRSGHYTVHGWDGLRVTGTGQSAAERTVLSAYPGEHPVLDVPSPDGAGCMAATAPDDPSCVREVVRVSGSYTVVQGLTIQNGLGYHVEVTGGSHHLLRCNTLGETVAFAMRSDCLKLDGGATDIEISNNDFSRFRSQAIDMTEVFDVRIEDNDFHDPIDPDAGATGTKLGASDVVIRGNRVHDLGDDRQAHAFALGGTGTGHARDHSAYRVRVEGNQIWNIAGTVAQLSSCEDCALEDNDVWNAGAGILLSSSGTGLPECMGAASGCGPNQGTRVVGNRLRDLNGGGDAAQANVFVFVEPGEQLGLDAHDNLYCAPTAAAARFGLDGELLDHDAWVTAVSTDRSSLALPSSDARCAF